MVRPYSIDLRERVVGAVRSGSMCREAAVRFGVAVFTVVILALTLWGELS